MAYAKDHKADMIAVDFKKEEVEEAVIDRARKIVEGEANARSIDPKWKPQYIYTDYGSCTVYFRAAAVQPLKATG